MTLNLCDWVIYVRISDDREGRGLGVGRQEGDCRTLVGRIGGKVVEVFVDNDLTAYNRSSRYKARPGYEKMCRFLRATPGVGVVAWHTDRIHRTPRELEDFIDLCDTAGVRVETVKSGPIDLRTPSGRAIARTMCAWAYFESDHKSERIKAKALELAEAGAVSGGGHRPFGFEDDRVSIRESEASDLRAMYRMLLAGISVRSICRDLNDRGVPSVGGVPWQPFTVRRTLCRARNAGLREHHGKVTATAVWPQIVERATWEAAHAILTNPDRRHYNHATARRYLLTGWAFCGMAGCGKPLVARPTIKRAPSMVCASGPPHFGCGRIRIQAGPLEEMVGLYVVKRLADPDTLTELAARESDAEAEARRIITAIEADEHRLRVLEAQLGDGGEEEIPELVGAVRRVRGRIADRRSLLARNVGLSAMADVDPATITNRWPGLDLDRRRALMALVVNRVDVAPALVRGLNKFDPRRVEIKR